MLRRIPFVGPEKFRPVPTLRVSQQSNVVEDYVPDSVIPFLVQSPKFPFFTFPRTGNGHLSSSPTPYQLTIFTFSSLDRYRPLNSWNI